MTGRRDPSHPPSAPPSAGRGRRALVVNDGRRAHAPLIVASLLGLVLVALGLYVSRRPRDMTEANEQGDPSSAESSSAAPSLSLQADAGARAPVVVSDARVIGCHDRGPKKTRPDECDHLVPIEHALATAIEQFATCVPKGSAGGSIPPVPGGTIEYVADVSFARRKVSLQLPRAGRSVMDRKVLGACATAVRGALRPLALDGIEHQHARYEISVTATYATSANGT